ncbi:MAG: hypothetical protein V4527_14920 [Pseudomonadota bacterium]
MARIRTIKPSFWTHEALSAEPEPTVLLAIGLLTYSDDEGYFNANSRLIQAEVSPLREPSVSIQDSLTALALIDYIQLGESADGRRYGRIVNFAKHQRINRPTASKISGMAINWEGSLRPHGQVTPGSPQEGKGMEWNKEGNACAANAGEHGAENGFEEFYAAFPKQIAKPLALKAWEKALSKASPATIIAGARQYAEDQRNKDPKFTKHPEKWLNEERWQDGGRRSSAALIVPLGWGDAATAISADIGVDLFNSYFGNSEIDAGPPKIIRVFNKAMPDIIESRPDVLRAIRKHLGKEIEVVYAAPKVAA